MSNFTLADEELLVHLIKNIVEENVEHVENEDGCGQVRQIRGLIRRLQFIELTRGSAIEEIPQTLRETMKYLKNQPISRYLPNLSEDLDEDYQEETALDEYNQLTPTLKEFVTEKDAHEQVQKHILELRQKIIDLGEGRLYEICRFFFCAENAFDSDKALKNKMAKVKIPPSWHHELLQNFYLKTTNLQGVKEFCPYCGEPFHEKHFEQSKVCRYFKQRMGSKKPIVKKFKAEDELYRLDPQVIKSIVIPNIGEQLLRDRLKAHPMVEEVEMYPFFDSYDLKVRTKKETYWLDVKDYLFPGSLANYFAKEPDQAKKLFKPTRDEIKAENVFLIVPKHRLEMSSKFYMKRLRTNLDNHRLTRIKIHGEDDFIAQILEKAQAI